jgi:hypothetical protein
MSHSNVLISFLRLLSVTPLCFLASSPLYQVSWSVDDPVHITEFRILSPQTTTRAFPPFSMRYSHLLEVWATLRQDLCVPSFWPAALNSTLPADTGFLATESSSFSPELALLPVESVRPIRALNGIERIARRSTGLDSSQTHCISTPYIR